MDSMIVYVYTEIINDAFLISINNDITVYDASYISLVKRLSTILTTAYRRLLKKFMDFMK